MFLKLPEFYGIRLNHKLEKKKAYNPVFLIMPILYAYVEHESNAQCIFLKCIVNLF